MPRPYLFANNEAMDVIRQYDEFVYTYGSKMFRNRVPAVGNDAAGGCSLNAAVDNVPEQRLTAV